MRAGVHPRVVGAEPGSFLLPEHHLFTPATGSIAEPRREHTSSLTPGGPGQHPHSLQHVGFGEVPVGPEDPQPLTPPVQRQPLAETRAEQFPPSRRKAGGQTQSKAPCLACVASGSRLGKRA